MGTKRVAVIGAGSNGIIAIKCLKEENIEPVCFEKSNFFGGLWRYHEDDVDGIASVMKTTIINTSKEMNSFSDYPPPDDFPNYMHNTEIIKYFTMLAENFDILRHIIYNKEVVKIELAEDYSQTGRLKVRVKDMQIGEISEDIFDGVAVCIGHHVYPNFPMSPGQKKFRGTILHSHSLKTVESFKDQVVVVVGIGNSGMDAAVETSSVAEQVYLSTRRGAWVVPRVGPAGIPFDMALTSRFTNALFQYTPFSMCCSIMEAVINRNFDHSKYNIKPKHRFLSQHPSVSDTLPIKLLSGTVKIRGDVKKFVENGVIFEGEEFVTEADAVIFATGYLIKFPFLSEDITAVKNNKVHLYKYIYPPHLPHSTFAILGLIQSVGAGFPIGEAQTRLFCQVFNGKVKLPNKEVMEDDIKAKDENLAKRYVSTSRHTIQVDYIPYLDELYSMFGTKPNLRKMLFTDLRLFFTLFFGPSLPFQYRLQGPHPWPGARNAILTYQTRLYKPLNKNYKLDASFQGVERERERMETKRVAVIGAGATGLAAIKSLKEENIEPVCFEKTSVYGGLWRYHEDDTEAVASVMKTTIINTSKEMGALSDFPPPEDFSNYMHNREIIQFFTMHAEKFDLLRHITHNKEVVKPYTMKPCKKVAIVGGGFGGISCMKNLKDDGIEPVCFEKSPELGGTWNYREQVIDGLPSTMWTTTINHSKEMGAISDLPPPAESPNYMRHFELWDYFKSAVETFDLLRHVLCNREVVSVKRTEDYEETGRWIVTSKNTENEETFAEEFDGVLVCVGHITDPKIPEFPGLDRFSGIVLHSHDLKRVEQFTGKTVAVIGTGCSAMDAAVEVSNVAAKVYLSIRTPSWIIPRVGPYGLPMDYIMIRRYSAWIQDALPLSWASKYVEKNFIDTNFNHKLYGIEPKYPFLSRDPIVNDAIPSKLLAGSVILKDHLSHFVEGGVVFEDDEKEVVNIDAVIMATGYTWGFPFLEDGTITQDGNKINLYKCMFPPHLRHPTLAIIGFLLPFGPGFPLGELQSRWASYLMKGYSELPSRQVRLDDINRRYEKNSKRFCPSDKMSIRVDYIPYMDEIASQFGVKPNLWKMMFTDHTLFKASICGPCLPYQYRLEGHNKWDGARDAILSAHQRMRAPLLGKRSRSRKRKSSYATLKYTVLMAMLAWLILHKNSSIKYYFLILVLSYLMSLRNFSVKYFLVLVLLPFYITYQGFVGSFFITLFIPFLVSMLTSF